MSGVGAKLELEWNQKWQDKVRMCGKRSVRMGVRCNTRLDVQTVFPYYV